MKAKRRLVPWLTTHLLATGLLGLGACGDDSGGPGEPFCGNGIVEAGEECDQGPANSDIRPGMCRSDCTMPRCGDGVTDPWEDCDGTDLAGNTCDSLGLGSGTLTCSTSCRFDTSGCEVAPTCGDGVADPWEECDDGAANSDTTPGACRTDCTNPRCGDGVADPWEECDDGPANSDTMPDACRSDCTSPSCGDGVRDSGEECDDGPANSDTMPDACRTDCTSPSCGDGVRDSEEECDDGGTDDGYDGCTNACTATDFQVNTSTQKEQSVPAVAAAADGRFVVVWQSSGQDGISWSVYARRYDALGNALGPESRVNSHTGNSQQRPSVAMAPDGRFVVAWQSHGQDGGGWGVFARRYAPDGSPVGPEFQVNSYTTNDQYEPSVAMAADGRFLIAWQSSGQDGSGKGVFARRYDPNGNPVGSEFRVNAYTNDDQQRPAAAMAPDGRFVIAWQSYGQDGDRRGVFAQRYDANGNPVGSEFRVNGYIIGNQYAASVAMAEDGRFLIAWHSDGQDGSSGGIFAQHYDAGGNPLGAEFRVNTHTEGSQWLPSVAMAADGRFVVAWHSEGQDGSRWGVFAQRFDEMGDPVGPEFRVNSYVHFEQNGPAVGIGPDGRFVVAWRSSEQDGEMGGIFAKLFSAQGEPRGPGGWN